MTEMKDKALMNLPSDIKLLLASGQSSLYRLPKKYAEHGAYLLALSHNDTFFITKEGTIGKAAGKLGAVEVEEVVRLQHFGGLPAAKFKTA